MWFDRYLANNGMLLLCLIMLSTLKNAPWNDQPHFIDIYILGPAYPDVHILHWGCPLGNNLIFTWADKTTDNVTGHSSKHLKVVCHMLAMPTEIPSLFILLGSESAWEWLNVQLAIKSIQQGCDGGIHLIYGSIISKLSYLTLICVVVLWKKNNSYWHSHSAHYHSLRQQIVKLCCCVAFKLNNNFQKIRLCQSWPSFALLTSSLHGIEYLALYSLHRWE